MASRDLHQLKEPFQSSVRLLLEECKKKGIPYLVTETTRTLAEQKEYVRKGVSWTLNSKHLIGEAVDIAFLVNGKLSYDANLYEKMYTIVKDLPYIIWPYRDLGWGIDKPHIQFDPNKQPEESMSTIDALKDQIKRLHAEVRKLTTEVHDATRKVSQLEGLLEQEKISNRETVQRYNDVYKQFQEEIDKRKQTEHKLKQCLSNKFHDLSVLEKIRILVNT